ncbi:c-Myc-binding protein [Apodemus speciosus]|uniref:c-Myc-binding protein n=1 Tax=Apodemus speciosus TaxID=105296 RepID=A0ABQ0EQ19_APOSI
MAHYKAADSKREQFRRYLEKSGVLDTLTKVVVASQCEQNIRNYSERPLYFVASEVSQMAWNSVLVALYEEPEKPTSALDHHLGAATPENPEIELLRLELAEMKEKYEATVEENKKLKAKLVQYEPPQEEKRAE